MYKTILYYKFVPVQDAQLAMLWQKELCSRLGIKGRVLVSAQGINGTLGGELSQLRAYKSAMNASGIFRGIHYKWSDANPDVFPRLSVKIKKELVAFGASDEIQVDENGVIGGGERIPPKQLEGFLKDNPDAIFFDGRNMYESDIGRFKDAVVPEVRTSRDFLHEIESDKYEWLKEKTIVTYCTGGVRCEILSALMINRGYKNIYQLDGGIVTYGKHFPKKSLWEGSCYVFDGRIATNFDDEHEIVGTCTECEKKTENLINCANAFCSYQFLVCESCVENAKEEIYCSACP